MNKPTGSRALTPLERFSDEITKREQEIVSMLPRHVSKERFIASAVAAVKQTPALLESTPRSLFSAVTKSAQDGLLPDGREGVITVYSVKQKDKSYLQVAQWNPMVFGLRKRARELDNILVDAQIVCSNDHFIWHQGDSPQIEHAPADLGTPRGPMIGVYAIWRRETDILHREVMDAGQIQSVKEQSKAPTGLLWTKFVTEAWRKTVVRRGFKSVPCGERLQTIVQRDDNMFAFDTDTTPRLAAPAERPKRIDYSEPISGHPDAIEAGPPNEPETAKPPPVAGTRPGFYLTDRYGNNGEEPLSENDFVNALCGELDSCHVYAALGPLIEDNAMEIAGVSNDGRTYINEAHDRRSKALRRKSHSETAE